MFGRPEGDNDILVDHTSLFRKNGDITKLSLHYDPITACVNGLKVTYGPDTANTHLIGVAGVEASTYNVNADEHIIQVQYKAGR
jgi:hypothetical protein